jgi:two-component sensor histidine kinase
MLLVSEFEHRLKNVLAVVQALARQTLAATVEEFRATLIERLKALGVAHLATLDNRREGIDLRSLLAQLLAPYGPEPGLRVRLEGPSVLLRPSLATSLALIFHELATNAAKHGALACESGRVELSWRAAADELLVEWQETGVTATAAPAAPVPTPAAGGGFGTRLIERLAVCQLGGEVEQSYRAEGIACRLRVPLRD